jgi:hypothetical protein
MNRTFSKEVQMAKKDMKKWSISLAIKEIQIKTMLIFHLIPFRMAAIMNTNGGEDVGKKEPSYTTGGKM